MRLHDAQRIRKADAVRAPFDGGVANFHEKIKVGTSRIFGCIANAQAQTLCITNMLLNNRQRLLLGFVQLGIEMNL